MIIGLGIDLISNDRIDKMLLSFDKKFKQKIFSQNEIQDAQNKFGDAVKNNSNIVNFFAKRFCAKEAFSKAIGTGIGEKINFTDIEVFNDKMGKPHIKILNNKMQGICELLNCQEIKIHLTLTDEKSISGAVVIVEKVK